MLNQDYKDYIKSPQWKMRCAAYWNLNGRWCRGCLTTRNLEVHHLTYARFKNESMSDLVGLCRTCHQKVHALHRRTGRRQDIRLVTVKFINDNALHRLRKKIPERKK